MSVIKWNSDKYEESLRRKVRAVLLKTAVDGVREMRESMRTTERRDSRGKFAKQLHRPSLPGHPPAIDTKILHNSLDTDDSQLEAKMIVHVGATRAAPYALYLEVGTDTIEPRPWLRPWFDRIQAPLLKSIQEILRG
jgi:hypothetical protein